MLAKLSPGSIDSELQRQIDGLKIIADFGEACIPIPLDVHKSPVQARLLGLEGLHGLSGFRGFGEFAGGFDYLLGEVVAHAGFVARDRQVRGAQ
jgi:hypothetical protein